MIAPESFKKRFQVKESITENESILSMGETNRTIDSFNEVDSKNQYQCRRFHYDAKTYCLPACRHMIDSINVADSYNSLDWSNHLDLNQRRWWGGITASSNHQQKNNIVKP